MRIKKKFKHNPEIQKALADAWLNIKVDENKLINPLQWPKEYDEEPEKYISWVMSKPEYFSFLCSEILNVHIIPTQALMLSEMWNRKFPMLIASRGYGKSFIMAVYALLRQLLMPKRKIVIAGAAFRQSKVIFEYMETIWNNAPLLRDIVGTSGRNGPRHEPDMYKFYINEAVTLALPIGDGSKIRGQRANDLLVDEFAALPKEIFENVLVGFAAVTSHPIDNVKVEAAKELAKKMGWLDEEDVEEQSMVKDNQIIISGTAYYDFNHFGEYWRDWHEIICSRGNEKKLKEFFRRKAQQENRDDADIPADFNWRDYSIIRIPFELIPKGFMDAAQVARSKATIHAGIYLMEYGACFSKDSQGFFKRSLIESCTASPNNVDSKDWPIYCPSMFQANLSGNPTRRYVYGVDPASEVDNFSIVVLELYPEHRRIVYGWTTNRDEHKQAVKDGLTGEEDFYSYCARKIRSLMVKFPCERIMMDSQGGGIAVMEALHDRDKMYEGEHQIWPIIDPNKEADTDTKPGLHILELVNFASADWTGEANHGLRKDMEDKIILFPYFDPVTLANAIGTDKLSSRKYDTLEEAVTEIEELKDELSTIIITATPSGRDKWDTPEVKLPGGKKGRLRKDRYSSLIMANMGARQLLRHPEEIPILHTGGFAGTVKYDDGPMYTGNEWFNEWAGEFYQ